jgi:hypothetical protein
MSTISYRHHERLRPGQMAAAVAAFGFALLGLFHFALALGAPLGHAAWGGDSAALTSGQRVGSAFSVLIYAAAAALVLARAGLTSWPRSHRLLTWGPWVLAALFAISALANVLSQSHWESYLLAPAAVVLASLCVVIARTPLNIPRR